ncbi:hypothetical protein [Microtetraspora malaysiensis]|uniref:hypothetical protein n=1 Tax=Microtetraspora malaysiensis TaxID=161358 RepID=UPI003D94069A
MMKKTIIAVVAGLAVLATPASASASASASDTKNLRLRAGLSLIIPSSWKVYKISKDWTRVVTGSCPTVNDEVFGFRDSGCRSFWVLGPSAIEIGHEVFQAYTPDAPFYPATDVGPCVYDANLSVGEMKLAAKALRQIGPGHKAYYRAWSADCVARNSGKVKGRFTQREWYLPKSKILLVDQWNTQGLSTVLKYATWS